MKIDENLAWFDKLSGSLDDVGKNIELMKNGINSIDTSQMPPEQARVIDMLKKDSNSLIAEMRNSGDPMAIYNKMEQKWQSGL